MRLIGHSVLKQASKTAFLAIFFLLLISTQSFEYTHQNSEIDKSDYVILLHGLTRSNRSMMKIEESLSDYGYRVINIDYPSTEHPIEYLADNVLSDVIARCRTSSESKINFVTHSLGGIIVRYYLKHHKLTNLGRVVMLSPPNKGSELVDNLKDSYFFKMRHGPAGQQLGTDKESLPRNLGPVDFNLGVITGSISFNLISSVILPGPDDGVVSVESAKVEGMTDFIVMPSSHTFIMKNKNVIKQILHFLEKGEFDHSKSGQI
jgi:pimeloyl-ACP methyl ester carboxylesterase